jgi:hypothetical protein
MDGVWLLCFFLCCFHLLIAPRNRARHILGSMGYVLLDTRSWGSCVLYIA